mmetsp:Transcript_17187/g.31057  ORF Transcript_17187/g.31057 Transcript_17187/m.31057 type:complete len:108 (+) Transcript_17187:798-1121(+)
MGVVLEELERLAAAGEMGLSISPLANTDKKGGVYLIMSQQFKRAMGVAIICGNTMHKLGRLHYVRGKAAEANAAATTLHSNNRWRPIQNRRARWFSDHVLEGYGYFG